MRAVAIHQPPYFPWFGLLDKIARAHVFIVLDSVQYIRRGFLHRTLYSTNSGAQYLSLSVNAKGHQDRGLAIADVTLGDLDKPLRHFETLRHRYHRRPGWRDFASDLERLLRDPPKQLSTLNVSLIKLTLKAFGLSPEIRLASELAPEGSKSALMLNLTQAVGGDVYVSGAGAAAAYMEPDIFEKAGVAVEVQDFTHPIYAQSHDGAFQPGCFALEWAFEDPLNACAEWHKHVGQSAEIRCLAS